MRVQDTAARGFRRPDSEQPDDDAEQEEFERRAAGFNSTNGRALSQTGAAVRMPKLAFLERRFAWESER